VPERRDARYPNAAATAGRLDEKIEGRTFTDGTLGHTLTPMALNDPLDPRQADTGAFTVCVAMKPLKAPKSLWA
jgi:hypothetical protein